MLACRWYHGSQSLPTTLSYRRCLHWRPCSGFADIRSRRVKASVEVSLSDLRGRHALGSLSKEEYESDRLGASEILHRELGTRGKLGRACSPPTPAAPVETASVADKNRAISVAASLDACLTKQTTDSLPLAEFPVLAKRIRVKHSFPRQTATRKIHMSGI